MGFIAGRGITEEALSELLDNVVKGIGNIGFYPTVNNGQIVATSSASIAAGGQVTLDSNPIASGNISFLIELVVAASVPLKVILQTVVDGVATDVYVWITDIQSWNWVSPAKNLVTVTGTATAGFDGFRAVITNLDISEAVDVYVTFSYDENV